MLMYAGSMAAIHGKTGMHAACHDMSVLVSNCGNIDVRAVLDCVTAWLSPSCIPFWEGAPIPKPAALGMCVAFLALQTSLSDENIDDLIQEVFAAAFDPLLPEEFDLFCEELPPYLQLYFSPEDFREDRLVATNRKLDPQAA